MNVISRNEGYCRSAVLIVALCILHCCVSNCPAYGSDALASKMVQMAGIQRGVCAVLGREAHLPIELARSSELLVHVRVPDRKAALNLQRQADEAGFGIDRVVVEYGDIDKLPYTDNMVDIVIMAQATEDSLRKLSREEVLRVLRPEGLAIIGNSDQSGATDAQSRNRLLGQWASSGNDQKIKPYEDSFGVWVKFRKPPLSGTDDWSHWEKGPDNNPVSADRVIKAPYMTQFMSEPFYIGMPSITTIAGGRTFLAVGHIAHHRREWDMLNQLIARNGYNGTLLWQRSLPEGYLVHRSAFIATKDTFYMIDGDGCLMLDPETGKQQGRISIPGVEGDWKWIAMADDILYVLAGKPGPGTETTKGDRAFGGWSWADLSKGYYGKRIPYGFGDVLAAYDLKQKDVLWKHAEKSLIDSRGMAMRDDKLYLYCPDRHLRCLYTSTGEVKWTSDDPGVLDLIEEPGKRLTSTPGFRTACITVATPGSLVIQGQTRMNVIAVSSEDGGLLWVKKKITNNPNAIFVDGKVVLGVGPRGTHVVIDPDSGDVLEDLNFRKTACTRLTASGDSFFCRGEGTLRFDRESKKVLVDGGVRPGCNDGAIPANGLLYIGPWQCDCNLSLIGRVAKCSAGDFRFDYVATDAERLTLGDGDVQQVASIEMVAEDWPTLRGNNQRTAGTTAKLDTSVSQRWQFAPSAPHRPTVPTAAGRLVFVAGSDGKVRALDAERGEVRWEFATPGHIKYPPTIWDGRAYFGSGDGYAYCLEAATGRLLWRFRAAPVERHIMVYGAVSSTWPVHSGVLVKDGVAYFAAGIMDHDGTYVYAVDAKTGKIKWQNNASGHLSAELRKGVSVQGNLTVLGNRLLLAGGNQVSPAPFDLETGECLAKSFDQGRPKANNGRFAGVFRNVSVIVGGRILYAAAKNVATKGGFVAITKDRTARLNNGGVPPAWDDNSLVMVNFKYGKLTCCDADKVARRMDRAQGEGRASDRVSDRRRFAGLIDALRADDAIRWQTDLDQSNRFEAVSLAVCPNAILAVVRYQQRARAQAQWFLVALNPRDGKVIVRRELRKEPLPGGLLVDRDGQVVLTMLDGDVVCFGAEAS